LKAIIQDSYGSVEVLKFRDIDKPTAGADDVLLRVHAAGVDPGVIIVGGEGGGRFFGGFQRGMLAPLRALFSPQKLAGLMPNERPEDLVTLKELIEAGKLMPVVDKVYPLSEAAEAIRYVHEGQAKGKVVIKIS
jgi:NADPH:quinone reductase-like Zn-dependent oxidoreductase